MQGQEGACLPLTDSGVFIRRLVWDPTSLRFLDWPSRYPKVEVRACVRACACMCTPSPYRLPSNAISVDKRSLTVIVCLSKFWVLL